MCDVLASSKREGGTEGLREGDGGGGHRARGTAAEEST